MSVKELSPKAEKLFQAEGNDKIARIRKRLRDSDLFYPYAQAPGLIACDLIDIARLTVRVVRRSIVAATN